MRIPSVHINDFSYDLPEEKIAQHPLSRRDESRLLIHKNQTVQEDRFINIAEHLPQGALMVYNETRVIQARLEFRKETGARIEIFCLEPVSPTREVQQAFEQTSGVVWKCLVGNSKKWKSGMLGHSFVYGSTAYTLKAERIETQESYSLVRFLWEPATTSFSEVLQHAGIMPLPPYMKRASEDSDKKRYQTIYARQEGSVAAPTAGLHFTDFVFSELDRYGIARHEVTLHVGAGTFKPVTSESIAGHEMHTEEIHVTRATVQAILDKGTRPLIAVGTTTLRTLESLYWFGVRLLVQDQPGERIQIHQWDPYREEYATGHSLKEAMQAVLAWMDKQSLTVLSGQTQLIILPSYTVQTADILITNFHMPKSTLLLLVAAFIGEDWKNVYRYALDHNFRFLSYGDSCLLFKKK